jgi:N-acetylneuraminate lyase
VLGKYSPIPAQKTIMKLLGTDLGPCRLPLKALNKEQEQYISDYLKSIHFREVLKAVAEPEEPVSK